MFLGVRASRSYRACIMMFAASPPRRGPAAVFQGTEKTISNANGGPAGCQIFGSSGISGEGCSRQEEGPAMATHAAPGVNGHGIHGPQPTKLFSPSPPHFFGGRGGQHNFRGGAAGVRAFRGFRGSSGVGWKGRATPSERPAPPVPGPEPDLPPETSPFRTPPWRRHRPSYTSSQ